MRKLTGYRGDLAATRGSGVPFAFSATSGLELREAAMRGRPCGWCGKEFFDLVQRLRAEGVFLAGHGENVAPGDEIMQRDSEIPHEGR